MKIKIISILLLLTISSYGQNELPKQFADLLEKGGLTFTIPYLHFTETPVIANSVLKYDYALKFQDEYNSVHELRFIVNPTNTNSPKGEKEFRQQFEKTLSLIFTKPFTYKDYVEGPADLENRADWMAIYDHTLADGYTFKPEFAQEYYLGTILSMHKKGLGDFYILYLFRATQDEDGYPIICAYCSDLLSWNVLKFK